jgi:hypothetical protein
MQLFPQLSLFVHITRRPRVSIEKKARRAPSAGLAGFLWLWVNFEQMLSTEIASRKNGDGVYTLPSLFR